MPGTKSDVTCVHGILLLMQAVEERKTMVVAVQLELQAAVRRAARQEALTEAAEGQLNTLKEENNEVSATALPRTSCVLEIYNSSPNECGLPEYPVAYTYIGMSYNYV